jgi:hypothetical protein
MFLTPNVEAGAHWPTLGVSWPVQVFILFGWCWYISAALSAPRLSPEVGLGISACALEVCVAFHKPIVFAGIGAIATIALVQQMLPHTRARRNVRLVEGVTLLALALTTAWGLTGGDFFEGYREEFYTKFLHMHASGGSIGLDEETLEHLSGGRFGLWDQAIDLFWRSPWVGSGPGQTFYSLGEDVHPHDGYIELLYSVGVIGALAHVAVGWRWFEKTILAGGFARRARLVLPIAGYVGGFLVFLTGGSATSLYSLLSFVSLLMGVALGYSVALQPNSQLLDRQRRRVAIPLTNHGY